jgi:hypothetical protein
LQAIWPWRAGIVGGAALLALGFLLLQLIVGFGIEHDARIRDVATVFKDLADIFPAQWQGSLYSFVYRTGWLTLAFWLTVLAVIGATLEFWLALRKSRPLPRVDISW